MTEIVILGAGYAGLAAAVQLAARTRHDDTVQVTLVNATDRFTERLRLPLTATGQQVADLRLPGLLAGTGARFEPGWVTAIDLAARTVTLDDRKITFDILVYALGSVADTAAVPGADEHAYTLNSFDDAAVLAGRLAGASDVVVGGAGPTGVESAAEIASRFPHLTVTLVGRHEPGAAMHPMARAHLRAALDRLGVRTVRAEIRKVLPDGVHLDGGTLPADLFLWAGGTRVSPLAAAMTTDPRGRIVTDAALRSVSHPFVYAVGDAAAIRQPYGIMHGTCQSGMPTGVHAALSILRELNGKQPRAFRFGYYHTPVSLGRRDGVVQFTHGDDSPRRLYLTGRLAARYKEIVTASPWPTYRRMRRMPASAAFWPRGKRA
ncbi:FAD-dependent oxidoreductase [Actinoplanes sp. KI2]|uniref:NAD(P)/FAD-dependent oxidoreductase n=1 Tax=Actinoplanes sp. KI2 TaxID=2983315 RepID=UPI0021D5DC30|nr:FAD-dependent oxidoreductase [Actinoplanes sp. KI2]MCU7727298.1 FAD-dependent oxidoreductase [Actinoplanes sp. KI2]